MDPCQFSDIMSGAAYSFEQDSFSLNLFADAAVYNKSGNKSMWAIFSSFVELPPILRFASDNIIFHSSWTGSNPDFNLYLEKYNPQKDLILKNGIDFEKRNYWKCIVELGLYLKGSTKRQMSTVQLCITYVFFFSKEF